MSPARRRRPSAVATLVQLLAISLLVNAPLASGAASAAAPPAAAPAAAAAAQNAGQGPPTDPILRIETGMHGARINRIVVDPRTREVFTAADDKTGRVWSLASAEPKAVLRGPIGRGAEGELRTLALSPSGKSIAVAGNTGLAWDGAASVYLFARDTFDWRGRIGFGDPPTAAINTLAFSPDGRWLVAGAADASGLRAADLTAKSVRVVDPDYAGAILALDFAGDGRLATVALDGKVRLYDRDLRRLAVWRAPEGRKPYSAAFDREGARLAVGFFAAPKAVVTLLSGDDLKPMRDLDGTPGRRGTLDVVAWSEDGASLFAAGSYGDDGGRKMIRKWPLGRGGEPMDIPLGADEIVTDLEPAPDGQLVFATAAPSWGAVDVGGRIVALRERKQADFRGAFEGCFAADRNGQIVEFGFRRGGSDCARFELAASALDRSPLRRTDMTRPAAAATGAPKVEDWRNAPSPKIHGRPVALDPHELSRAAAVGTDGAVVLGTDFYVRFYRKAALAWKTAVPSPAWAVNLTPDGRLVVAALGDGTIRWLQQSDGKEVLSFFALRDSDAWVAWTPEGLFDHGPGGEALIGYHQNRVQQGQPKGADFVRVQQLYSQYFRPDLVAKRFRGEAVAETSAYVKKVGDVDTMLDRGLPPAIRLAEFCVSAEGRPSCRSIDAAVTRDGSGSGTQPLTVTVPEIELRFTVEDRGGGVGRIEIRRQDAPVPARGATRGLMQDDGPRQETRTVQLQSGLNEISLSAFNAAEQIETAETERPRLLVQYQAPGTAKSTLRLLSIGVNHFANPELDRKHALKFAVADAEGIVEAMRGDTSRQVYDALDATLLVDQDATLPKIEDAFRAMAARARADDVALVFLAGHGINIDGKYHFLPYDLRDLSEMGIRQTGLSHDTFAGLLGQLQTTRVLIAIDTCYSGAFSLADVKSASGHLKGASQRYLLAGATDQQESLDGISGHGVFTTVLLEGLRGKADETGRGDHNNSVEVSEVLFYTRGRVPALAREIGLGHRQQPYSEFAGTDDFALRSVTAASSRN